MMFWAGHAALTGDRIGSYSVAVDKSAGKILLRRIGVDGRITRTWECVD